MINKQEYLLVCLAEECAEIQKVVMKALRFGLDKGNPLGDEFISNHDEIQKELNDVVAVVDMLNTNGFTKIQLSLDAQKHKKEKINKYMEVSISCGILKGEEE